MLEEIASAAEFLLHMLRGKHHKHKLTEKQLIMFERSFSQLLRNRYKEHWFPEHPNRGSGYRCIRINSKMDPVIAQAADAVGLHISRFRNYFPVELTLWIDPQEVSYRIGENGSICVIYERCKSEVVAPPRESPELYLDPRQMEQRDPLEDYIH